MTRPLPLRDTARLLLPSLPIAPLLMAILFAGVVLNNAGESSAQDVQVPEGYEEGLMWPSFKPSSRTKTALLNWIDEIFRPASDEDPFVEPTPVLRNPEQAELASPTTSPKGPAVTVEKSASPSSADHTKLELAQKREADELRALNELVVVEDKVAALMDKVIPCIVSIGESGSGVLIKSHGIVITASHVTQKAGRRVQVRMYDGRTVEGITLGSNAANDTSAIRLVDPGPWPYLKTVPLSHQENPGDWCVAFGYPMSFPRGRPAAVRLGRITGSYNGKLVADCPIMGGDSGGPLVDLNGHILAVCSSVKTDITQNMYVPISRYRDDWKYVMASRDVDNISPELAAKVDRTKPFLGIYGESGKKCVRVRHVHRGSPAEVAGLVAEDVIHSFDGQPIEDFTGLLKLIHAKKPGEFVTASINRFGQPLELSVQLGKQN